MTSKAQTNGMRIDLLKDGPIVVSGSVPLIRVKIVTNDAGDPYAWEEVYRYPDKEKYILCRCGKSAKKPYCDGAHVKQGFTCTTVASHETYTKNASVIEGDGITLLDAPELCIGARFCHRGGGVWKLTRNSDHQPSKELAIEEAQLCPAGRLAMFDTVANEMLDADYEPSIALIEDPYAGASSAIWVRGYIPFFDENGVEFEPRNYFTLCRCGHSRNMPFCDAMHYRVRYDDGHIFD